MIDDISPPGSWVRELSARPHTYRDVWAALREAEARLAAVEAERDALRADAERYRWLRRRNHFGFGVNPPGPYTVIDDEDEGQCFPRAKQLDAAIDAARGGA